MNRKKKVGVEVQPSSLPIHIRFKGDAKTHTERHEQRVTHPQWSFASGTTARSWKGIHTMGRHLDDDCKLSFIPPSSCADCSSCAKISKSEINVNVQKWENTLVEAVSLATNCSTIISKPVSLECGN